MLKRRALAFLPLHLLCVSCSGPLLEGSSPDAGPPALACPDTAGAVGGALELDGVGDYVTMGKDSAFGLATFTIEAWVRRDGLGATANSGVGGLNLVPIAAKGRGEGDRSNVDTNYLFGFWGDVLGADFEDFETGGNHPVTGTTPIPYGQWHHVAASFDGTTWRLYVDGALDGEAAAAAMPRSDSDHALALGTALTSKNVPAGFLRGALDEVRLWDHARTADEIADGVYRTIAMGGGLVGRWSFDLADGRDQADDSAGGHAGTLVGEPRLLAAEVVLDQGEPPIPGTPTPADGSEVVGGVVLDLPLEMATAAPVDVVYRVRELTTKDDFTIVVLPDTQYYTLKGPNDEKYFYAQTQWVRDNREEYNIVAVLHNGDLINNQPIEYQWNVANRAMSTLEVPEDDLPDGVPYGIVVGNHDNANVANNTAKYNELFGVERFAGRGYYGGHYGDDNDEHWFTFSAGDLDFVVVDMQFNRTPDPAVLAWGRSIFEMHPDAFGILNTHNLIGSDRIFDPQGQAIYDVLKDVPNVHLMTCGHVHTERRRADTFEGHTIHTMLADYQDRANHGGLGFLRIWEFSPANQTVTVRTYSPAVDQWQTDEESEFTLDVPLRGAGGSYQAYSISDRAPDDVALELESVEPGKAYEWYAEVSSCGKKVTTPVYRFATASTSARERGEPLVQPPGRDRSKRVRTTPTGPPADDSALED